MCALPSSFSTKGDLASLPWSLCHGPSTDIGVSGPAATQTGAPPETSAMGRHRTDRPARAFLPVLLRSCVSQREASRRVHRPAWASGGLSIPGARLALCADDISVRHSHGQRARGVHRGVSGASAQNTPVNVCTGANVCQQVLELQTDPGKQQDRTVEHGDPDGGLLTGEGRSARMRGRAEGWKTRR